MDLRHTSLFQFIGAAIPLLLLANFTESMKIDWTAEFYFGLTWSVVVLSMGAVMLLMYLIRIGSAARTASFFYLVPVSTVIFAYFLFGEVLQSVQILGMAITIAAVARGMRKSQ